MVCESAIRMGVARRIASPGIPASRTPVMRESGAIDHLRMLAGYKSVRNPANFAMNVYSYALLPGCGTTALRHLSDSRRVGSSRCCQPDWLPGRQEPCGAPSGGKLSCAVV
jgi:hypothetical protein